MRRHKTLIWSLALVWGQSRADWDWPLSVRLWEESICSDGELRERETHRPETLCHTDDAGDHFWQPPGAGARDHGFFTSASPSATCCTHRPFLDGLQSYMCHKSVCLSHGIKEFVVNNSSSPFHFQDISFIGMFIQIYDMKARNIWSGKKLIWLNILFSFNDTV